MPQTDLPKEIAMLTRRIDSVYTKVGEGPLWDPRSGRLYAVDLLEGIVLILDSEGRALKRQSIGTQTAAVTPIYASDDLAVVLPDGFYRLRSDGSTSMIARAKRHPDERLADAKVDREGRLLAVSSHAGLSEPLGGLYRLDQTGQVTLLDAGFILGNGPCWSPDGSWLYVADSWFKCIYRYEYRRDGSLGPREVFIDVSDRRGIPDGATVDSQGRLWVAMHGSPYILCFSDAGILERKIEMPTANITSVMFGGDDLGDLWVTSLDPTGAPVSEHLGLPAPVDENAGSLFVVQGLGVTGISEMAQILV